MTARTPTQLSIARGNPGHRPLNSAEPNYTKLLDAKPPPWLQGDARREWKRLVPELVGQQLLATVDLAALAMYCQLWSMVADLVRVLKDDGYTYRTRTLDGSVMHRARPESALLLEAATKLRTYASEFGFTPAARTKVRAAGAADDVDPLESALFGGGA